MRRNFVIGWFLQAVHAAVHSFASFSIKNPVHFIRNQGSCLVSQGFALCGNECNWVAQGWLGMLKTTGPPVLYRTFMEKMTIQQRFIFIKLGADACAPPGPLVVITWSKIK